MELPQSLICCNGVRLTYGKPFSHEKGTKLISAILLFGVLLTVVFIVYIERDNFQRHNLIEAKYSVESSPSNQEPTDLTDDTLSYGIIFDCGSSGTRVYIYYWPPHSGSPNELLDIRQVIGENGKPLSKKVTPGLSTYYNNASNAAEYLRPLLEFAANVIPEHKHHETPLYIQATAGMRLISKHEVEQILLDITSDIPNWFNFLFEPTHVEVISGKTEGMYAWISLNYMLGRFSLDPRPANDTERKSTVGVIDMGGGSLQIAFEVSHASDIKDQDYSVKFNLGSDDESDVYKYAIYSATFLGYGANSALSRYRESLVASVNTSSGFITDDCQALGSTHSYRATDDSDSTAQLKGTGDIVSCMSQVKDLLNKHAPCRSYPCSINGTHQPAIPPQSMFYGISEYWYSTYDVLNLRGYYNLNNTIRHAEAYCKTPWDQTMLRYSKNLYPHADMDRMRNECFKVSWIIEVLHKGLGFPLDFSQFLPVSEINGQEVQWSLGALVYKTRYLPSKSRQLMSTTQHHWRSSAEVFGPYILLLCIAVALAIVISYCRHLQKMKVIPSMKSVPSMTYFMNDHDIPEQGLVEEKHFFP